jgi:hypothetical protein
MTIQLFFIGIAMNRITWKFLILMLFYKKKSVNNIIRHMKPCILFSMDYMRVKAIIN